MSHPKHEQTLVVVKPDGVQRSLIGEIVRRFERAGLKLAALKMVLPSADHIEQHYTLDLNWRRLTGEKTIKSYKEKGLTPPSDDPLEITAKILVNLKKYMTSGPVVAMVWQGAHAVKIVRKITGGKCKNQSSALEKQRSASIMTADFIPGITFPLFQAGAVLRSRRSCR